VIHPTRDRLSGSGEGFRRGSGGGIVGSGSPGTGSRLSGSGFEALGQRSGGLGSHLEDSTSLWCWSYGITLSSQTETRQTCCLWCMQRKLLLDFLYAFCDIAARVLTVSGPGEIAVSGRSLRNRSLSLRAGG